jgi:NTP pyrophosphatase (non-canonical NTP hydrolase)
VTVPVVQAVLDAAPMDISELAKRCHANSAKWFPSNHVEQRLAVTHCTLGLAGEAGEVANKVKKLYGYVDQQVPPELRDDIVGELIDTLIYDLVLLDLLGADIPIEVERVVAKCVARWGPEAAVAVYRASQTPTPCPECDGKGYVMRHGGIEGVPYRDPCEACGGSGVTPTPVDDPDAIYEQKLQRLIDSAVDATRTNKHGNVIDYGPQFGEEPPTPEPAP